MKKTQKQLIKRRLETCLDGITPMDALKDFGCFRLSARIKDLRNEGMNIITEHKNGYARYKLDRSNGIFMFM